MGQLEEVGMERWVRFVQVEQMSSYLMSTNNKLVASVPLKMELISLGRC